MIHGRSWRRGEEVLAPGERELMDLSPAEGTTRPDFFWVAYTSRRSVSLRLVHADGSPCGGRHALGCSWGPVPCGIDPLQCSSAQANEQTSRSAIASLVTDLHSMVFLLPGLIAIVWSVCFAFIPLVTRQREKLGSAGQLVSASPKPCTPAGRRLLLGDDQVLGATPVCRLLPFADA